MPSIYLLSLFLQPQQSVNSFCGSPETQTAAGQTGFFGATPPGQQPNMPSPPYTPYDNSPPHTAQRFTDPCISGTTFQDYQVFPPNSMATSTGYLPQTTCQQPYSDGQYMQQNYQQTMAFSMSLFNGGSGNACYTAGKWQMYTLYGTSPF